MLHLLVVSPPSTVTATPAPTCTDAERQAFETGYILSAHAQLCRGGPDEGAAALAHRLETELRERLSLSGRGVLRGGCPLASGAELRRGMSVRAAMYELLGETTFHAQGVEGTLPTPIVSVLSDAASVMGDTKAGVAVQEFKANNRDADLLHRRLFGGCCLPFHDQIQQIHKERVPK